MSTHQTQTQTQGSSSKKAKDLPYVIEDFLNIDPEEFTLGAPKPNKIQGSSIPIKYKGKALYVKYDARTCPFGVSENKEKDKPQYATGSKVTGYSTSIQCDKEYESDPYYLKALELDNYFIGECIKNSVLWGLGGSKTKPIAREAIEGYDDKGDNGKWKRLVKYAYKKVGTEKVYTDYAPRLEFALLSEPITESTDSDGKIVQHAGFRTAFFTAEGEKVESVDSDNISDAMPNWSKIAVLAQWTSISLGTYGASLKPKASQIRVFPNERLNNDACMLGDDDEDDEEFCLPEGLALLSVKTEKVKTEKVVPVQSAPVAKPAALVTQDDDEEDETSEQDEETETPAAPAVPVPQVIHPPPHTPAPVPVPVTTARRTTRVVQAKN
jgi:hypothetical protein